MTFEVDGVAYPLQFLFEAKGVKVNSEKSKQAAPKAASSAAKTEAAAEKVQPVAPAKAQ